MTRAADTETARWFDAALAALDIGAAGGDNGARHAKAVLCGSRKAGRKAVDDAAALAAVAEIATTGRARAAVGIVARRLASTPAAIAATERRLREKMKRRKLISPF